MDGKVKYTDITVRSLTCHTSTGTHVPYRITECYLPPDRGDIPACVCVVVVSASGRLRRKRQTLSQVYRASLRRQRRQTHATSPQGRRGPPRRRSTDDILQLAKSSQLYSPLLNNYTLPGGRGNASLESWDDFTDNSSSSAGGHGRYETAIVYGQMELTITNLRHFQEYSIEVGSFSRWKYSLT